MTNRPEPDRRQSGTITPPDFPGGLADRGIGFQAAGFTLVWTASTAILTAFDGSGSWLYQGFHTATTGTYWATLVPLAALFDWVRNMFEKGKAIREAKKAEILEKARAEGRAESQTEARQEGRAEGRAEEAERIRAMLEEQGVNLSPETAAAIFGGSSRNGS